MRPGIDVLLTDSTHLLRGRRVGLVSHAAGVDRNGVRTADRLATARGVDLVALFSPEHGFRGLLDQPEVPDETDAATGLPIYSLYRLSGPARDRMPILFRRLDVLVVDLQDIGARTYTYPALVVEVMEVARDAGVAVVVLDRPNPLGGVLVQGPMRDSGIESFVARLPVPLRHGLTIGELARLANREVGADLVVVPVDGWRRHLWFDDTGLPWVRPSPNMPGLESATHYPGLVLFERTNLSVGRGTEAAFRQVGAPWVHAGAVLAALEAVGLRGVRAEATSFVPDEPGDGKYPGAAVQGIRLTVTEREHYDPVRTAVALLWALRRVHGDSLRLMPAGFDERAGTTAVREGLEAGLPPDSIVARWAPATRDFTVGRGSLLLYR